MVIVKYVYRYSLWYKYYIVVINQIDIINQNLIVIEDWNITLFNTPYTSSGGINQLSEIKNTCPELENYLETKEKN